MSRVQLFVLFAPVLSFGFTVSAATVQFAPVASNPAFLLESENLYNPGGIERSWYGHVLTNAGQRDLAGFRQEMSTPGRYGGGVNWDGLPDRFEIANSMGVPLDVLGLPSPLRIMATTSGAPLTTATLTPPDPLPHHPAPTSGDNMIGRVYEGWFSSSVSRELTLEFQPAGGLKLHGFGMVIVDSGADSGGLTVSFYNSDTLLDQFSANDGILFHNQPTNDNFVGYWSDTEITRIHMETSGTVIRGRFDDLGLVFVPEPSSLLLLGIGGLAVIRRRRCLT